MTYAALGHAPNLNYSRPGYMGIDYLSNAVWVRCIKLLQGSMPMEYVSSLRRRAYSPTETSYISIARSQE